MRYEKQHIYPPKTPPLLAFLRPLSVPWGILISGLYLCSMPKSLRQSNTLSRSRLSVVSSSIKASKAPHIARFFAARQLGKQGRHSTDIGAGRTDYHHIARKRRPKLVVFLTTCLASCKNPAESIKLVRNTPTASPIPRTAQAGAALSSAAPTRYTTAFA